MADAKPLAPALEEFCRDVSRTPLLTAEQEKRLGRAVREGGARLRAKAREILVKANVRLVFSVAKHFTKRGLDLQDLVQEGTTGLMTAAERYDERRGTKFSTYATYWIKHAIREALKNQGRTVRVPSYQWELVSQWDKAVYALYLKTGEPPREEDVLKRVRRAFRWKGFSHLNALDMRSARRFIQATPASLSEDAYGEEQYKTDSHPRGAYYVPDHREGAAENRAEFREEVEAALGALDGLTEQERTVLRLRFGLGGGEPLILSKIGQRMGGLTRERVRQIERDALDKLKAAFGQPVTPRKPRKPKKKKPKAGGPGVTGVSPGTARPRRKGRIYC